MRLPYLFLLFSMPALAGDLVCYSTAFAPYVIDDGKQIAGIDVDVVAQAAQRAGISVQFKLLPWVRLESDLRRGRESPIDCAFAYTSNEQRKTYMDFMQVPLKVTRYQVFARKDQVQNLHGVQDLKGKVIGLRRGFVVPGEFEEMRKKHDFVVQEVDDDVTNFRKLMLGRIDVIVANADVGRLVLQQLQMTQVQPLEPALVEVPTYLVFNKDKGMQAQLNLLNKALSSMQSDGSIRKIREKYLK